jgi:hypothetical protein
MLCVDPVRLYVDLRLRLLNRSRHANIAGSRDRKPMGARAGTSPVRMICRSRDMARAASIRSMPQWAWPPSSGVSKCRAMLGESSTHDGSLPLTESLALELLGGLISVFFGAFRVVQSVSPTNTGIIRQGGT